MKGFLIFCVGAFTAMVLPIEVMAIILMFIIFIDTIVKMFSLRKLARSEGRKFRDVFSSKILRQGYLYKGGGYLIFTVALLPFDYYILSPYVALLMNVSDYVLVIHTKAIFTNGLLIIFCMMELSSINENWFDISGNNLFSKVFGVTKKIREAMKTILSFKKDVNQLKD